VIGHPAPQTKFASRSGHCHMEMEWIDREKENKEILLERK
jgi:hypothetical protein